MKQPKETPEEFRKRYPAAKDHYTFLDGEDEVLDKMLLDFHCERLASSLPSEEEIEEIFNNHSFRKIVFMVMDLDGFKKAAIELLTKDK